MTSRAVAVVLACVVLSLVSCSNDQKPASSYGGTAPLARALNAHGVSCTGLTVTHGGRSTEGAAGPVNKGARRLPRQASACSHGKSKVLLFSFKTSALRDRWLALGGLYGSVVVGPNWTITTASKDLADRIRTALGGQVRTSG